MNLFQLGNFKLASGQTSAWKINCDALTLGDWSTLACIARELLPPFGEVEGVPTGGDSFAEALRHYISPGCKRLLIADDVLTTSASLERQRNDREAIGVVVFARGPAPHWCVPLFALAGTTDVISPYYYGD